MSLKKMLKELNFNLLEKDADDLIENMLDHLGSTDPELRDQLIYSTFGKLILSDSLSPTQMEYIAKTCLGQQYLFYQIGKVNDDSVFTRSFSALVIALILEKDRQKPFLSQNTIMKAIESSLLYLQKEEDTRGFVEGKGWAHSIAHGADLLVEAIKHPLFDDQLVDKSLDTIGLCLFKEAVYMDDEDERLIFAIEALMDKGVDERVIEKWVFNQAALVVKKDSSSLSFYRRKTNVSNFLRTFYFRLLFKKAGPTIRKLIEEILEKWNKRIYY